MSIEELRSLSSAVFGHRYRLELLAALATTHRDEGICLTLLADACGVTASVYYPSVKVLLAAGLAYRMSRTRDDPHVLYARTPVPAWTALRHMVQDLEVAIGIRDMARRRAATS